MKITAQFDNACFPTPLTWAVTHKTSLCPVILDYDCSFCAEYIFGAFLLPPLAMWKYIGQKIPRR